MKAPHPPVRVTNVLERLVPGPQGEALAGDLIEQYAEGRSPAWFWRQATLAVLLSAARDRTSGARPMLPWIFLLFFIIASAVRHPASMAGAGKLLLAVNIALLVLYAGFAVWVWSQRRIKSRNALEAGAQAGLVIAVIFIANHAVGCFAPASSRIADFASGSGVTLVMLGLFGMAGSLPWARTRSVIWGGIATLWCACEATLFALSFAFGLNYMFEPQAISRLNEALVASGMSDAGAFITQNGLLAGSEALIRMPLTAAVVGVIGALINAGLAAQPRRLMIVLAWLMPVFFVSGAGVLWHAHSLNPATRAPFIVAGVVVAAIALCGAHPIWSSLSGNRGACAERPRS